MNVLYGLNQSNSSQGWGTRSWESWRIFWDV